MKNRSTILTGGQGKEEEAQEEGGGGGTRRGGGKPQGRDPQVTLGLCQGQPWQPKGQAHWLQRLLHVHAEAAG